jgi:predicted nuclease of predicted toxin-antitoxin system
MKLLLDQDVYAATARFLSDLGHDTVPAAQVGLS